MTIEAIFEALDAKKAELINQHGASTQLSQTALDNTTDQIVDVLNTVNPTAPYPPKAS